MKLDLTDFPGEVVDLCLVARTPGGRPLRMHATPASEGRYAGMAAHLGQLSLRFGAENTLTGIEAKPSEAPDRNLTGLINELRKPIDFGWTKTNGAFRLMRLRDGLVLTPLPDCPPFEATLKLTRLGISPSQIRGIVSRELFSSKWALSPVKISGDELTVRHDPKIFSYSILLDAARN